MAVVWLGLELLVEPGEKLAGIDLFSGLRSTPGRVREAEGGEVERRQMSGLW